MDIEEVVDRASSFLTKSGYLTYKLDSVNLDKSTNEWKLKFDVGALTYIYITLTIDDITGRIIAYEKK